MPEPDARERLLDFLEARVFQRVLDASPEDYESEKDRKRLERVRHALHADVNRYRALQTVDEIVDHYRTDLERDREREVFDVLHELGLPALPDVRDEFHRTARDLGYRE